MVSVCGSVWAGNSKEESGLGDVQDVDRGTWRADTWKERTINGAQRLKARK